MPSTKKQKSQAARLKKDRAKLRSLGLLSKKVDLRKKPTTYQKKLIERYRDVLTGKAKIVKAKDASAASKFKKTYDVTGDKIIVPVRKGERIQYSEKKNEIVATRKERGKTIRTTRISEGELAPLEKGQYWVVPFAGGQRFRTNDFKTLLDFMKFYESKPDRPYKNWRRFVEIEDYEDADDETINIKRYTIKGRKKRVKRRGVRKSRGR